MRKLLFITLICSVLFSCSEDDPLELGIKTLEVSLYPEDVVSIDAISDFDITYLSTNPYFVDVSAEGMLTANKVGKTRVEVSSHDHLLEVSVDVMGRYNVYPDPIVDWGISQSELIEIAGEPNESRSSSVEYIEYSEQAPAIAYLFTPEDALMSTMVMVSTTAKDDLIAYMDERFVFDSVEDDLVVYCNAHEEEDVTLLAGIFDFGGDIIMVLYIENEQEDTKSGQTLATDIKNMRNQMKALANEKMNK